MNKLIWLASFPRSGNTFARNVLYQSYGLMSTEVNLESLQYSSTHEEYPVVKTHLRPWQVPIRDAEHVVVYLVRDGRDALVSIAHHRTNIVAPGSDFLENLEEAFRAEQGSYFGGWGLNVAEWMARADIIIRFEDLILDPIGQLERIRDFVQLPDPEKEALPTFSSQRFGNPKYGPQKGENQLFFRKGKSNGWKDEMPDHLEERFWQKHGQVMESLGYLRSGERTPIQDSESIRSRSANLIHRQSGIRTVIKQKIQSFFTRTAASPGPQWNIQPELIFLDTGVDLDQQFKQALSSIYQAQEIGIFNYPGQGVGQWTDAQGLHLPHPETCKVVISDCSRPEFLARVQLQGEPKWIAWIREPVRFIAEAWERSKTNAGVLSMKHEAEWPEDFRPEIEAYIQTYANRNRMHRVISSQSIYLDAVGDLENFQADLTRIADLLGWSHVPQSDQIVREPHELTQLEWFCASVRIYDKKDIELYNVWKISRNVNT
ncbi:MAG: sulfotransferase domain-containing protein [Saprospiraceae bacterium]|nr:sulfotransferase domain-containing protein [Saprospiraceae bacterium]